MNYGDFIIKYAGQPVDVDHMYGNQCMDLMHRYVCDVWNLPDMSLLAADCAKNVWLKWKPAWDKYFTKIPNTPTGIPQTGDIIFWGGGTWGHVAIYVNGNVWNFISFDQNYPTGTLPHTQYHNYQNVLGWVRRKV